MNNYDRVIEIAKQSGMDEMSAEALRGVLTAQSEIARLIAFDIYFRLRLRPAPRVM